MTDLMLDTTKLDQFSQNLTDLSQAQFTEFTHLAKLLITTAQTPQDLQTIRVVLTGKKKPPHRMVKTARLARC